MKELRENEETNQETNKTQNGRKNKERIWKKERNIKQLKKKEENKEKMG